MLRAALGCAGADSQNAAVLFGQKKKSMCFVFCERRCDQTFFCWDVLPIDRYLSHSCSVHCIKESWTLHLLCTLRATPSPCGFLFGSYHSESTIGGGRKNNIAKKIATGTLGSGHRPVSSERCSAPLQVFSLNRCDANFKSLVSGQSSHEVKRSRCSRGCFVKA